MKNYIKALACVSLVGSLALGSMSSFATVSMGGQSYNGLPGIVPPSLPAFGTSVYVNFIKGSTYSTLTATFNKDIKFSVLAYPNKIFKVEDTKYTLSAKYSSSGVFQSGNVKVEGQISGLGINSFSTLMTADLTAFAKNSSGTVYGFNTKNIVCNPKINAYAPCTTGESIYLALSTAQQSLTKSWSTKGIALTSVPIPAAAWLFGSGLIGLAGVARRKKKIAA